MKKTITTYIKVLLSIVLIAFVAYIVTDNYGYIFSRKVVGKIEKVERVQLNVSLMQTSGAPGDRLSPELYSFAVAIKEESGEIVTASTEDRQWAVAQAGQCADARFYPYPPWRLDKSGTYYGARLIKLSDCR